ncbi:MAG: outer membrane protein assembly factor BamE [Verrucomicrobiota bacterium]|nr:outer membrane protein assembly factor BamE [Verrucomicrobiota bacterium]
MTTCGLQGILRLAEGLTFGGTSAASPTNLPLLYVNLYERFDTMSGRNAKILLFSIIAIFCVILLLGFRAFQPPVPLSKLTQVKRGMTRDQVREILGEPSKESPGGGQWTYDRFLAFGYVNVSFQTNGTVSDAHYEEF